MIRWPRDLALANVAESPAGALPADAVLLAGALDALAPAADVAAAFAVVGAAVASVLSSLPHAASVRPATSATTENALSFIVRFIRRSFLRAFARGWGGADRGSVSAPGSWRGSPWPAPSAGRRRTARAR